MKRFVRPGAFLLLAALLFCLSGCYSGNIDQYFSLPMASEEYRQLQSLIDEELASGSEYAAPIHGSYRQSVQLSDVDGDGADEALAFFRDAAKGTGHAVKKGAEKAFRASRKTLQKVQKKVGFLVL